MERFKPIQYEAMNRPQRELVQHYRSGWRAQLASADDRLGGPLDALVRAPELATRIAAVSDYFRVEASLPQRLIELTILIVARSKSSHYEWYVHRQWAEQAGLRASIVDAIARDERPAEMDTEESALYTLVSELLKTGQTSDISFAAARAAFNDKQIVELIALSGFYVMVAMVLGVAEVSAPVPEWESR